MNSPSEQDLPHKPALPFPLSVGPGIFEDGEGAHLQDQ